MNTCRFCVVVVCVLCTSHAVLQSHAWAAGMGGREAVHGRHATPTFAVACACAGVIPCSTCLALLASNHWSSEGRRQRRVLPSGAALRRRLLSCCSSGSSASSSGLQLRSSHLLRFCLKRLILRCHAAMQCPTPPPVSEAVLRCRNNMHAQCNAAGVC